MYSLSPRAPAWLPLLLQSPGAYLWCDLSASDFVQLFLLEKLPEYSFSGWQQLEKCSGRSACLNAPESLPDFLYAALDTTACAAFIKESRMNLANANKLHRKSGPGGGWHQCPMWYGCPASIVNAR
jgi:hypothetical protein